ncbi:MAG: hypothetical protein E6H56_17070 [Betaproteobacteria bacterium]|nr:MAG: hypothetical protein E6H56_17070 [Betaproteobacteria bacterium]
MQLRKFTIGYTAVACLWWVTFERWVMELDAIEDLRDSFCLDAQGQDLVISLGGHPRPEEPMVGDEGGDDQVS